MKVNQRMVTLRVAPESLLIDVLRDQCQSSGTRQGCDTVQCGACTVLVDGLAIKSCNRLAMQCANQSVLTIEGIAPSANVLHIMQQCFSKHHGLQCGFCTPGFVMRALAMVQENLPATPHAVRQALAGNLCRCTGYEGIVAAICEGLVKLRAIKL